MKTRVIVAVVAALGVVAAHAQPWTYIDVTDGNGSFHPDYLNANTYNALTDSSSDWVMGSDGANLWRYRNTGPGVPSWGGNAYQGRYSESDWPLYTLIAGLSPNTTYDVRVYGVYPENPASRYGAEFSVDGGSSWQFIDNRGSVAINWVDNSTPLGAPLGAASGDTRFFSFINGTLLTDGAGVGRIDIRVPQYLSDGQLQDRFVIDGYAVSIPEPTSFALGGLAAAALLILRRRR